MEGSQKVSVRSECLSHSSHLWHLRGICQGSLTRPHWSMPNLSIFLLLFMETNFSVTLVSCLLTASWYWALLSEHVFIGTPKAIFMTKPQEAGISLSPLVVKVTMVMTKSELVGCEVRRRGHPAQH